MSWRKAVSSHRLADPPDTGSRRVRAQLSVAALVVGAMTVSICAFTLWRSWGEAMHSADAEARNLAILIDRNVSTVLDKAGVALAATSAQLEHRIAAQGIDRAGLRSVVDSGTALAPEIAQMVVFDAQGQQLCGEEAPRCLNLSGIDRDYFHQLRTSGERTTRLYAPNRSGVDGRRSLVLARDLRDGSGSFAGVVVALIPLYWLESVLQAVDLGPNGMSALRGTDLGLILRYPSPPEDLLSRGGVDNFAEFALAVRAAPYEGSWRGSSSLDNVEQQTRYRRLSSFPIYVVVGLGTWDFLAPWRVEVYWTLCFLALFMASSALIARLLLGASRDQQRIQELYDNAPCGYHSLDADGIFRRINATELRWLGCTSDEVIGKLRPMDFYTAEGKEVFRRSFRVLRETGKLVGSEVDLLCRDGTSRRVVVSATALHDVHGRFVLSNSVMYDVTELHKTRLELDRLVEQLEDRVEQRTQELRLLAAELDAAESRERQQLARDLHDDLGQTLAAARLHLSALDRSADQASRASAVRIGELIECAIRSTRSLAAQLAPPMLYELGLAQALEWLGEEMEHSFGLKVAVVDDGQPKPLSKEASSVVYRATRELLINSAKHARADTAEIEIERHGEDIVVRVADSGVGFDVTKLIPTKGQGMGLLSVRERLSFIGGSIDIQSMPGDGAVITLVAPLSLAHEVTEA